MIHNATVAPHDIIQRATVARNLKIINRATVALSHKVYDDYYLLRDPPIIISTIVISYIILLKYGPSFMQHRKPYNVKFPMLIYNVFQVCVNGIGSSYVFIILKKNHHQLSLLHCYHHLLMATGGYFIIKWFGGGPFVILGLFNSAVHAIMYFYYLLSTFRSDIRTSIQWKKHITQLQMLQFIIVIISFLIPMFVKDCEFSKPMSLFMVSQTSLILYLFARFYVKAYLSSNKSTKSS
ncbi:very long chain fatty acid elongase F-like [Chironomus tepperi]|uniref:very long chain fatty acid elongase F-like n=1 Tax=Chironomus tepperi TaxID=113505 RepID=UPI00391F9E76